MSAETVPDVESTIEELERQFDNEPQAPRSLDGRTMLDILGIELPKEDIPETVTMTGFTDYVTKKGDGL